MSQLIYEYEYEILTVSILIVCSVELIGWFMN